MAGTIKTLFVYGTLLKGEERCHYLADCHLLRAIEVPGMLYDTGRGYPAAVFDEQSGGAISGELYLMPDPEQKLKVFDTVEQVESGLYERVLVSGGGMEFVSYQAGAALKHRTGDGHRIKGGSWRRFPSLAFKDPLRFALNFESLQERSYRAPVSTHSDGLMYIKGDIPVIITAAHATAHVRLGKLKRQEFFTGALAAILHNTLGCHVLYTNSLSQSDPNYYDDSPFKDKLAEIYSGANFKFLIDLHGTGPGCSADIFPGTGSAREFLLGNDGYFDALLNSADSCGVSIGGEDVFPAVKQMTVTKFSAKKLGVPSMQLEIARELRQPESSPDAFIRLVGFLKDFIAQPSLI